MTTPRTACLSVTCADTVASDRVVVHSALRAHRVAFVVRGAAALAEIDDCLEVTFIQCLRHAASRYTAALADAVAACTEPIEPVAGIARTRESPCAFETTVYSLASPGDDVDDDDAACTTGADAVRRAPFHVLVQYARVADRVPGSAARACAARGVGLVAHDDLLGPAPATLVMRTAAGNPLWLVPVGEGAVRARRLAPLFKSPAALRRLVEGVACVDAAAAASSPADSAATTEAVLAHADACAGFAHDDSVPRTALRPSSGSVRPAAACNPRECTAAPEFSAELAQRLVALTPDWMPRGDRAALRAWIAITCESHVTGVVADDAVAPLHVASDASAAAREPTAACCSVPWTAVARGEGGALVRAHTYSAHVRHVRALWTHTALSARYDLAVARVPDARTVLVALPRAGVHRDGSSDGENVNDDPCIHPLLFAPGAWQWPTPWLLPTPPAPAADDCAGGAPLGFWDAAALEALRFEDPAHAAAMHVALGAAYRAQAAARDAVCSVRQGTTPLPHYTVCMHDQCVYSQVIKCRA